MNKLIDSVKKHMSELSKNITFIDYSKTDQYIEEMKGTWINQFNNDILEFEGENPQSIDSYHFYEILNRTAITACDDILTKLMFDHQQKKKQTSLH